MPNIAIRHRLTAVVLFSILPIALLGWLFVAQSQREIAFSAKEIEGTRYIETLMPDLVALARQHDEASPLEANGAFELHSARLDTALGTKAASRAYSKLRDGLSRARHPGAARHAAARLIAKVGDGSNLILDPDLDSYYVMDTLVARLPQAINAAPALLTRLELLKFRGPRGNADLVALAAGLGAFQALVAGTAESLAAASAGNADGTVARNLEQPLAAYLAAANSLASAIAAGSNAVADESTRGGYDPDAALAAYGAFNDAALAYWQAVADEMTRLLEVRVAGLEATLVGAVGIAAALVAAVLVLSWLLARSIVGRIARLEADIVRLADDEHAEIDGAEARDEVAGIARAVEYLRDRTVERLLAADGLQAVERERAEAARRLAEEERERHERRRQVEQHEQRLAVEALGEGLERISRGDLTARLDTAFAGDLEAIRLAFNETVTRFADVMARVHETSRSIKTATGELVAGTNDLSDRTARQASTIDEISVTVQQLASTVDSNAERAQSASRTAGDVSGAAQAGGAVMHQANEAMERITASSTKISSIIGLIDDIAFQTNLLALNASVEAARAGEAGKGFAVVAVEVRRLAQSAAEASKEIKALIERSVGEVAGGSRLVAEAVGRLTAILESAESSTALMETIARESRAQATAFGEINRAVREMHEMTQHNAALVEQTNAAIEQTEAQATELDRVVAVFALGSDAQGAPGAPAPRSDVRTLQEKAQRAARSYRSRGNAALDRDWPNS